MSNPVSPFRWSITGYVEGLQHALVALDLDPLNLTARADFAIACAYARDDGTAVREYETILALEPRRLLADHDWDDPLVTWRPGLRLASFEQAATVAPDHPISWFDLVMYLGAIGAVDEDRRQLEAHIARIGDPPHMRYKRAQAEAFLGDRVAAMTWLASATSVPTVSKTPPRIWDYLESRSALTPTIDSSTRFRNSFSAAEGFVRR